MVGAAAVARRPREARFVSFGRMTVLGIDYGSRRIGLAISDPEDKIALPAGTLESQGRKKDLAAIASMARERGVDAVVIGLPLHMNGREGPEAAAARRFAAGIEEALSLPVTLLDERWTTVEADRALQEGGRRSRKKRKAVIDTLAATLLLRSFLERHAQGTP